MAGEYTPINIQIILDTTTDYLDASFSFHHDWPYYDVEFYTEVHYPTGYLDKNFILLIPGHSDWPFEVVVPADDQLAHHFWYIVPADEHYDINFIAGLEWHDDWLFEVTFDVQLDISISIYADYIAEDRDFYVAIQDLEWADYETVAAMADYGDVDLFIPTPGYLDSEFLLLLGVEFVDIDIYTEVGIPWDTDYLETWFLMQGLSEGDVSLDYHMGLVPQYRTVNRIQMKEHPHFGSVSFSLMYQQDIDEPFQLFNITNATINELPVSFGDPLLTNPVIGNVHRTGEIIDIYVSPVVCTSVKVVIFETEHPSGQVRMVEFGLYEDIVDTYAETVNIQLDPERYHLKSLEMYDDKFFDIIVINTQADIPDDIQSFYSDISYIKFIPTHTPPEEYFVDLLRLHIMQTYFFGDVDFIFADRAPYVDIDFLTYSPDHTDVDFWMGEWIYLDHNFYFEGGITFDDWDFRFGQLADTPLDTDFLTYSPEHKEIEFLLPAFFEGGNEPEFILQSDIDDYFVNINAAMAEYLDSDFEVMVPGYEEIPFFMRHWNYLEVTFHLESQVGDWMDWPFDVGVVIETWKDWPFFTQVLNSYFVDSDFEVHWDIPYSDHEFEMYHDIPYIDTEFVLISSRRADGELYGNFNIPQTIKQSLPGAFNILNTPVSGVLYGNFNIARTYSKAIITIPVLNPEEKAKLDRAGIKV